MWEWSKSERGESSQLGEGLADWLKSQPLVIMAARIHMRL